MKKLLLTLLLAANCFAAPFPTLFVPKVGKCDMAFIPGLALLSNPSLLGQEVTSNAFYTSFIGTNYFTFSYESFGSGMGWQPCSTWTNIIFAQSNLNAYPQGWLSCQGKLIVPPPGYFVRYLEGYGPNSNNESAIFYTSNVFGSVSFTDLSTAPSANKGSSTSSDDFEFTSTGETPSTSYQLAAQQCQNSIFVGGSDLECEIIGAGGGVHSSTMIVPTNTWLYIWVAYSESNYWQEEAYTMTNYSFIGSNWMCATPTCIESTGSFNQTNFTTFYWPFSNFHSTTNSNDWRGMGVTAIYFGKTNLNLTLGGQ